MERETTQKESVKVAPCERPSHSLRSLGLSQTSACGLGSCGMAAGPAVGWLCAATLVTALAPAESKAQSLQTFLGGGVSPDTPPPPPTSSARSPCSASWWLSSKVFLLSQDGTKAPLMKSLSQSDCHLIREAREDEKGSFLLFWGFSNLEKDSAK